MISRGDGTSDAESGGQVRGDAGVPILFFLDRIEQKGIGRRIREGSLRGLGSKISLFFDRQREKNIGRRIKGGKPAGMPGSRNLLFLDRQGEKAFRR